MLNRVHDQFLARTDRRAIRSIDAEWLVDNFYIIEDSLREVRRDLPPGYDEQLPKLGAAATWRLSPRLLAGSRRSLPTRTASWMKRASSGSCARSRRSVRSRSASSGRCPPCFAWSSWKTFDVWPRRWFGNGMNNSGLIGGATAPVDDNDKQTAPDGVGRSADAPSSFGELTDPFVVRLLKLLREQAHATVPLERLLSQLAVQGSEPNEVLGREHRRVAANQVTVGNCVLSLRLLSAIDWNAFFEQSSWVEAILREDPSEIYGQQDFQTSDRYRRAIETIARRSNVDEIEVARHAIELARGGRAAGASPRDHVGFYLIDRGQADLKAAFSYKPGWRERLRESVDIHSAPLYFTSIALALGALVTLFIISIPRRSWHLMVVSVPRGRRVADPAQRDRGRRS